VKQFTPDEGHYTNHLFMPPWETWQESKGEWTIIPLEYGGWYELRWPDLRYYRYSGDWAQIKALVDAYNTTKDIRVYYNWTENTEFSPRY
jgi:hypothetical protein